MAISALTCKDYFLSPLEWQDTYQNQSSDKRGIVNFTVSRLNALPLLVHGVAQTASHVGLAVIHSMKAVANSLILFGAVLIFADKRGPASAVTHEVSEVALNLFRALEWVVVAPAALPLHLFAPSCAFAVYEPAGLYNSELRKAISSLEEILDAAESSITRELVDELAIQLFERKEEILYLEKIGVLKEGYYDIAWDRIQTIIRRF